MYSEQGHQYLHRPVVGMGLHRAGLEAGAGTLVWLAKGKLLRLECVYLTLCVCVCVCAHTYDFHPGS